MVTKRRDMDMDNSEFMELMDELGIPSENIIECHEPKDSLEILQNLEKQYGVDTSVAIDKSLMTGIPEDVFKKWTKAFNSFMEYHGDVSLINNHPDEYVLPDISSQEAGFVNSASFFVQ